MFSEGLVLVRAKFDFSNTLCRIICVLCYGWHRVHACPIGVQVTQLVSQTLELGYFLPRDLIRRSPLRITWQHLRPVDDCVPANTAQLDAR
jgi:hypothetical protein